jgi:GWxTD domain-containing protein
MIKRWTALLGGLLLASSLTAGGLSKKMKEWPKSPQAYFMTHDEQREWKEIKTDAEAQKFIDEYLAKRGPDFQKMIQPRIEAADKYFSADGVKGSETMRGKVVVLFGPPSGIATGGPSSTPGASRGARSVVNSAGEGASPSGGVTSDSSGGGNPMFASHSSGASPSEQPQFTLVYDEQAAPKAIGKAFRIDLAVYSADDQQPVDPKTFEELQEKVAQASIIGSEGTPEK